jgi:hypothetical protein
MKSTVIPALGLALSTFAFGCGPSAGTQPHAMSAAEHEAAANQEAQTAATHGEQYDPSASATKKTCTPARGSTICWTSTINPTAQHSTESDQHRKLAVEHRAGSEALRNAEASACAGIPEEDRDVSPFQHREDIRSIAPYREELIVGRSSASPQLTGARVVFRAVPGMTAEWLQRVIDCHLARNAAIGHEAASAEMPDCPLTLRNATARVESVGDGFAVTIRSDDAATAKEIVRRTESVKPAAVAAH